MRQWIVNNASKLLLSAFTLVIGISGGLLLKNAGVGNQIPYKDQVEEVGQIGKPSVLPDTMVDVSCTFLLCGHIAEYSEKGGKYTGMTQEDIYKNYSDARVLELSSEKAVIEREIEKYCPDHFMLYINSAGEICIANTDKSDYEKDSVKVLSYNPDELDDEIIKTLEEGIVMDTLEDINTFFESVEN